MNKFLIAAIAAAAITSYFVVRRRASRTSPEPVMRSAARPNKHLTTVFSRAKKYSM